MMWNKKRMALITAVAVAFSAVITQAAGVSEKKEQLRSAQENVQQLMNQKEQAQELLDQMKKQQVDLSIYIEEVDARMTEIAKRIYELEQEIATIEEKISDNEEKLEQAEEKCEEQQEAMKKRIRYMYENGESDYIELLLSGKSIAEILNRAEYISKISVYDRDMLDSYEKTVKDCKELEEKLTKQKKSLEKSKKEQEDKLEAQQILLEAKQKELADVNNSVKSSSDDLEDYNDQITQGQNLAEQLQKELQEEVEKVNQIAAELASKAAVEAQQKSQDTSIKESAKMDSVGESERKEEVKTEQKSQQEAKETLPSNDEVKLENKEDTSNAEWQAAQEHAQEVSQWAEENGEVAESKEQGSKAESQVETSTQESATVPTTEATTEVQTTAPTTEATTEVQTTAPTTEATTEVQTTAPTTEATTEVQTTAPTTAVQTPSTGLSFSLCWPLPSGRTITSNFGPRPVQPVAGTALFHHGVDIYAPMGSEIVAAAAGTVVYVGNGADIGNSGCGNQVWISHDGGRYMTMYNHCSATLVNVGQTVNAGTVIALVGSTGLSTGPHLDFRLYLAGSNAIYNKTSGDYLDPITGDYLNPNDMSGTRYPGASIQYYGR